MKKIPFVCLILALCLVCALPTVALAADGSTVTGDSHIFLTNPIAVAAIGNDIYVADNLESNHSVVFRFDVSGDVPVKTAEKEFDKAIVNIAEINGKLAVIFADKIVAYTITDSGPEESTIDDDAVLKTIAGAVDIAYGQLQSNLGDGTTLDTVSYLVDEYAYYLDASDNPTPVYHSDKISNTKAVAFFDGYFYYAFDETVHRYNGTNAADAFNTPANLNLAPDFVPTGILTYTANGANKLALFDGKDVFTVTQEGDKFTANTPLIGDNGNIVDVCYAANKLFVLDDNHRIEIYVENPDNPDNFVKTEKVIGTDTIDITPPTLFTSFTTVKSLGYPTNIIYKTTDTETSIDNIVTDCKDEFVILDFDGAATLNYYYVMYGNKFGWVRKSVGATAPENDAKIEIVNNDVGAGGVTYTSKFNSLNAVYIYKLPVTGGEYITLHQTIDDPIEFTFLQKFNETLADGKSVTWFYIEYGERQHGFILDGTFGAIGNATDMTEGVPCKSKKINSSLFEAVKLYLTQDMEEGQEITDDDGNVIKLYSGAKVNAIEEKGDATFIQVVYNNGDYEYGWVPKSNLIDPNRLTTNAIVGICLLSVAVVLAIVLIAVFVERKKRKRKKAKTEAVEQNEKE